MMGWKACCGLWASKDDEDHDYYDDAEDPLPKPKSEAEHLEHLKSQQGSSLNTSGLSIKASGPLSSTQMVAKAGRNVPPSSSHSTATTSNTERAIEKMAWEAGAASAASTPSSRTYQQSCSNPTAVAGWDAHVPVLSHPASMNDRVSVVYSASGSTTATTTTATSSSSSSSSKSTPFSRPSIGKDSSAIVGGGGGSSGVAGGIDGVRRRRSGSDAGTAYAISEEEQATPSAHSGNSISRGAMGAGEGVARLPAATGASRVGGGASASSIEARVVGPKVSAVVAAPSVTRRLGGGVTGGRGGGRAMRRDSEKDKFDLVGFVAKLDRGVLLTKINRQGKAKVRSLFYDETNKVLWWNEPGAGGRGTTNRPRSGSLLSRRKHQPLHVATLLEVRKASQLDAPFCFEEDVDKSFQLVFPQRTVDLVAKDEEEASLLAAGFQELKASVA